MTDFCSTLRERRLGVGLSQAKLAKRAGINLNTIRNIEHGRVTKPLKYTMNVINAAIEAERQNKLWIMSGRETK